MDEIWLASSQWHTEKSILRINVLFLPIGLKAKGLEVKGLKAKSLMAEGLKAKGLEIKLLEAKDLEVKELQTKEGPRRISRRNNSPVPLMPEGLMRAS